MLKDKVIIVTGSSGLIGKSIVADIKSKGGVPICADITYESNDDSYNVMCDITSTESIINTINVTLEKFGRIDGLVNNAYPKTHDWGDDFESIKVESLKQNVDWQLNSYILFCQKLISMYLKDHGGAIVNIASIYGVVGNDFTIYEGTDLNPPAAYTAIKGGIINFTKYLASKYGVRNVRVNCVSPGGIFANQPVAFVQAYENKTPMKRMGTPDDIAPAVSFLLSDEAGYITGQNLIVDGGWTSI